MDDESRSECAFIGRSKQSFLLLLFLLLSVSSWRVHWDLSLCWMDEAEIFGNLILVEAIFMLLYGATTIVHTNTFIEEEIHWFLKSLLWPSIEVETILGILGVS